ncbi:mitogen-activated protein kinase kinase kinase 7-like [Sycon ciliatum]|uniref:mitogen-activated protein kinase kinase kinase 7-like n=1 Tax=Sycon ciliatum TaxID=27933 RepID=UPI0031F6C193
MEREALPLMRELGLTQEDLVFLGDVQVRQQDELGRGSDALVYRVNWQGIDVALKVLHPILIEPGVQDREEKLRSFGQEVFRLSRVHHPNLCQLLGIARVGRNAALALELLTSTLEELSVGEDRDDGLKLVGYLCDTSAGIRYLHVRGILHRDLAPKNVMIKNGVAKVCDFGVAKFVHLLVSPRQQQQHAQASRMAMTRCPGTLLFMPPEALVEQPEYDRPLDVFSLGVTLLAVLTGVMPGIDLLSAPSVVVREVNGRETRQVIAETRRRAEYLHRLPDEHPLKALILRCHSNEPSERPTAEEVHEEMKRVLQLFTGLSTPHLSNVPPAVVRRLDSISEQLTQQATSITALSTRSDTLEEQLAAAIANNQTTTQQQLTATQQQLTAAHDHASIFQDEQRTATLRLTEHLATIAQNQATTQQQLTATQQQVSTVQNEQTATNRRVEALANQLSDTHQRLEQQLTTTLTHQNTQSSQQRSSLNADHVVISPRTPATSTQQTSTPASITSRESLSSSASATAAGSATSATAEATAAERTDASSAGRATCHVLPAMPTPSQIASIKKHRQWNKLAVRQEGTFVELAVYSNKLVAVWHKRQRVTRIKQTSDLHTWHSIDLSRKFGQVSQPSLASHAGKLYMFCRVVGEYAILQYSETEQRGARCQWRKIANVPFDSHVGCVMHVSDSAISLFGGNSRSESSYDDYRNHASTYCLSRKQWESTRIYPSSLDFLPQPCCDASLVKLANSVYIIGGSDMCCLKALGGKWIASTPPDNVMLVDSAACTLSDHSMVVCHKDNFGIYYTSHMCSVHDTLTDQVYSLPDPPRSTSTPSLTLFGSALVLGVNGVTDDSVALYSLNMSV